MTTRLVSQEQQATKSLIRKKKKKKVRINLSIPNVSIAVPIFHVLRSVAVGIVNVLGYTDLNYPHVFA